MKTLKEEAREEIMPLSELKRLEKYIDKATEAQKKKDAEIAREWEKKCTCGTQTKSHYQCDKGTTWEGHEIANSIEQDND